MVRSNMKEITKMENYYQYRGYYENGKVMWGRNYKDGKLDGQDIGYYENIIV